MLRTFNCGIGMIAVVARDRADAVMRACCEAARVPSASARHCAANGEQVSHCRTSQAVMTRRRIAILISGRGSNMACTDRGRARRPIFPARSRWCSPNRPEAAGLRWRARAGIEALAIDHTAYPDRASFERRSTTLLVARHRPRSASRASCASSTARVRRKLGRPDDQHPPVAAAAFSRHRHAPAGARRRRPRPWLHGAFRCAGARCRADHRPGRGAGAVRATRRRSSPRACWRRSTCSIRRRSG